MAQALTESYIQDKAIAYLKQYYQRYSGSGRCVARKEVRTKAGKRADGLVVWRQNNRKLKVASLEAKSAKTLPQLVQRIDEKKMKRDAPWLSALIIVIVFTLLWRNGLREYLDTFWIVALYLALFAGAFILQKLLTFLNISRYLSIRALEQLTYYPANEAWIAIGEDSLDGGQFKRLQRSCRRNGFGLLIVRRKWGVKVKVSPVYFHAFPKKDFLVYYSIEDEVRKKLAGAKGWGSWRFWGTAAQRRESWRVTEFAILALVVALAIRYGDPPPAAFPLPADPVQVETPKPAQIDSIATRDIAPQGRDCRLQLNRKKYVIKDKLFVRQDMAELRILELKNAGFFASDYLWLPCFDNPVGVEVYLVYPFTPRIRREKTQENFQDFLEKAAAKDLALENPRVISLAPLEN